MNLSNGFINLSDIKNFARMIEDVCLLNKESLSDEQAYQIIDKIIETNLLTRLPFLINESESNNSSFEEHTYANKTLADILDGIGIDRSYHDLKRRVVSTEGRNISWLIKAMQSAQVIAKQQRENNEKK
ncbi:hypothetical protein Pcaca05_42060 [Pectobacterium carotovorum subsp. carotovorum]|nr:hypothetical protein Pcaca05_42060 [Pectobacterium carotovorum subsp. carotovorum]